MSPRPFVLLLLVSPLLSSTARADDPFYSDLAGREPVVRDLSPLPFSSDESGATLSVTFTMQESDARRDFGGTLALTLPTDGFLAPAPTKAKRPRVDGDAPPASPGEPRAVPRSDPSMVLPLVRTRDARAAISCALDHAGLAGDRARLDDLDSRARWSGLMPRLRLRATRLVDESESLSPTSYDAERTTASGGTSLWLEARATFDLDRLVFADDELRIERMRQRIAKRAEDVTERVLEVLFAWQRNVLALYDPLIEPLACVKHALLAEEMAVRLDWMTDGWFSGWVADHPLPPGSCLDVPLSPLEKESEPVPEPEPAPEKEP